jgi:hypothetical protein
LILAAAVAAATAAAPAMAALRAAAAFGYKRADAMRPRRPVLAVPPNEGNGMSIRRDHRAIARAALAADPAAIPAALARARPASLLLGGLLLLISP